MDLKFKKLLLLSMRMNDANNMMIKVTPRKVINLNFFINVSFSFKLYFMFLIRSN